MCIRIRWKCVESVRARPSWHVQEIEQDKFVLFFTRNVVAVLPRATNHNANAYANWKRGYQMYSCVELMKKVE